MEARSLFSINWLVKKITLSVFIILCSSAGYAGEVADEAGKKTSATQETTMPNQIIQSTIDALFNTIRKEKAENKVEELPNARVKELVEEIVMPSVDFIVMSRWVVGKYWRKMTNAQKKEFTLLFKGLLIKTYAGSLSEFVDYKINYFPYKHDVKAKKVSVRMEIERTEGPEIPLVFKLRKNKKKQWKVYDVLIDGISLIANYRTTFSSIAKKKGVPALIDKLKLGRAEKEAEAIKAKQEKKMMEAKKETKTEK